MRYIKVGTTADIALGHMKKIHLEDTEILLAHLDDGFHAIADKCPHMGGSLSAGHLEGNTIRCPKHGTLIDIKTGKILEQPKMLFIKAKARNDAKVYPVKILGTDIEIGQA
jgi:3-phenylpropionate/trans-cinnamate dioxygenase ferredoxin component